MTLRSIAIVGTHDRHTYVRSTNCMVSRISFVRCLFEHLRMNGLHIRGFLPQDARQTYAFLGDRGKRALVFALMGVRRPGHAEKAEQFDLRHEMVAKCSRV